MTLALCSTPFILPSGESGVYTFHLEGGALGDLQATYEQYTVTLSDDATYKGLFPTSLLFAEGTVREIDVATGTTISTHAGGTAYACTGGTEALPPQCSVAITERTAISGRSYRGRFYHPAPTYLELAPSGRIQPSVCDTLVGSLGVAITGALAEFTTSMVVYSRTHHATTVVTGIEVGDVIDTQRRRRDGLTEARHPYPF